MDTERAPRIDAGFTLIEVLFAMLILSVGLLALESLGIGAAAAVRRADVRTTYTAMATNEMETAMNELNRTPAVAQNRTDLGNGGAPRIFRTVTTTAVAGTAYKLYTVRVRVLPPTTLTGSLRASDSINVVSNVVR